MDKIKRFLTPLSSAVGLSKGLITGLILGMCLSAPTQAAGYFKDNFTWGYNTTIWKARSGNNGSPFGCAFTPSQITPSSHGITLLVTSSECSELQTKAFYNFGKVQGSLKTGNTAGTVSSIFTYTSWWDSPGRPWQEIDIEFLPSLGNKVHTNVIYQPQGGNYQSWEQDIDLGQYGLDIKRDLVNIGFDWSHNKIDWYLWDKWGNKQIIRRTWKDNGDGHLASNEIPSYAWPKDPTRLMINHWRGDNSQNALYFPQRYNGGNAWAYYDYIEYIPN